MLKMGNQNKVPLHEKRRNSVKTNAARCSLYDDLKRFGRLENWRLESRLLIGTMDSENRSAHRRAHLTSLFSVGLRRFAYDVDGLFA